MMQIRSEWISRELYQESLVEFGEGIASIYHRLPWLDALKKAFGADICFVRCLDHHGKIFALTPFMSKRKGPFRLIGTPLSGMYTEFAGPLFHADAEPKMIAAAMASIHGLLIKEGHYIEWGSRGSQNWGDELFSLGYDFVRRDTLLVDLAKGEDAVWGSFEGRARNMTRKAEKAGVVVSSLLPDEKWIADYYGMLIGTFARQNLKVPHPLSFYRQMISLSKEGVAHCVNATMNGEMIAGGIFLIDGSRMLYLSGAANELGMRSAATSVLQWHAIKEAIRLGVTEYDMGGLGVPSIDKFKRSFGGYEFTHSRWVHRSRLFGIVEPMALWAVSKGWLRLGGV
ncbi:peptidoglycan bridge formation glycyltransferase FemA/FemB family protein [Chromobacterium haemolyticum]|uniref:Peptidoglycan bridge formation glycyltransferase FemA/FemB family protein n=1 Tax=Chromobacterium fluminis TaxID=3044269 RepID=A0ABX0LCC1_9NEIS|nr:GNAT family N-acetyltransferase [Chromobacterium haemolyticum]NHR06913.1 peptidoglycan bridge formation glycyltransferase FemA/FemB family protein [Chromobacterium haemolyticum]